MTPSFSSSDKDHPEKNRQWWKAGLALLVMFAPGLSLAHDIWLYPEQSIIKKGGILTVHQFVGPELEDAEQGGTTKELPLFRRITTRFDLVTNDRVVDLLSELPDEKTQPVVQPVLQRKLDADGLALVVMDHAFIYDQHSREKFLEYLAHEEYPLFEHEQHDHGHHKHDRHEHTGHPEYKTVDFQAHMGSRADQRERYRRSLKVLVQVGTPEQGDLHRRRLGQELEILLLQNPYQLNPGATLDVQIIFHNRPLTGVLVKAYNRDASGSVIKYKARTDAEGIARFKLDRKGLWLFRLVHLRPCIDGPGKDCKVAHWESDWASYSFKLD